VVDEHVLVVVGTAVVLGDKLAPGKGVGKCTTEG
jgi:hypothetical protein